MKWTGIESTIGPIYEVRCNELVNNRKNEITKFRKNMSGIGGDANTMSTINRPTSRVLAPPGGGRLVFTFKISLKKMK